ncbi:MAG: hypothetical protein CM15mP68_6870 [Pseudomonadota bacterium]|nr:MAG: hypothetical protein CM15mP68_6870 [Pseudomonadota bacterium]
MRIATLLSYAGGFKQAVAEVQELEKAGLDVVWVPEAYSSMRQVPWVTWRHRPSG